MQHLGHRKGMAIASLNVNSLQLHLDEIICLVNENGIHTLAVNETKLDNEITDNLLEIEGYTLHREDRSRNGGGVAVYVRNSLKHNRRTDIPDKSLELVCIEIETIRARLFLKFAWYRPPSALIESFKELEGNLEFFDKENKEMIIMGDTNYDFSSKIADEYSSSLNNTAHLAEIYDLFGLTQMIGEPTRVTLTSSTLIDNIATNRAKNVAASGVFSITLSDHYLFYISRKFIGSTKPQRKTISIRNEEFQQRQFPVGSRPDRLRQYRQFK